MSITIDIRDTASGALKDLSQQLANVRINPVVGRSAVNRVRGHFARLQQERPNRLGGKRTGYWAGAARGTFYDLESDGVRVGINQVGLRMKYEGGTVLPGKSTSRTTGRPTKYLTIPAIAEAYGKRAGEFPNLQFVKTKSGGMLVEAAATSIKHGKKGYKSSGKVGGRVYFWLVRQAQIKADKSILPSDAELQQGIGKDVSDYLQKVIQRGGKK